MNEKQVLELFERSDCLLSRDEKPSETAEWYLKRLDDLAEHFRAAFGRPIGPDFPDVLLKDVERFKPLVRALWSNMTAPIHTVLYCVLTGARVHEIEFRYVHLSHIWLEVTVTLDSDEVGVLVSEDPWDPCILNHLRFGVMADATFVDKILLLKDGVLGR